MFSGGTEVEHWLKMSYLQFERLHGQQEGSKIQVQYLLQFIFSVTSFQLF